MKFFVHSAQVGEKHRTGQSRKFSVCFHETYQIGGNLPKRDPSLTIKSKSEVEASFYFAVLFRSLDSRRTTSLTKRQFGEGGGVLAEHSVVPMALE